MFQLKHRYSLHDSQGIISLTDDVDRQVILAFKKQDFEFLVLEKWVYTGFTGEISEAETSTELLYALNIHHKYPELFHQCSSKEDSDLHALIRKNLMTFKDVFMTKRHYDKVDEFLRRYEATREKHKLLFISKNDKFDELYRLLQGLVYLEVNKVSEEEEEDVHLHEYDFLLIDIHDYQDIHRLKNLEIPVLIINYNHDTIEIGPLIFSDRFEFPKLEEGSSEDFFIQAAEESLIFYFVQRIAFIVLFELFNEIQEDISIPMRNKLIINKTNLEGTSEHISLHPKVYQSQATS